MHAEQCIARCCRCYAQKLFFATPRVQDMFILHQSGAIVDRNNTAVLDVTASVREYVVAPFVPRR